jgi:hypothetical protein
MKYLLILLLLPLNMLAQTFTYSGYIYNTNGSGASNIPIKLYKRTTPTLTGFTSQNNYNGHSYYRSTGSMTWTEARQACLNMGGYLVTLTSAAENNFIFNLWPSGWIGLTDEVQEGVWRWVTGEPFTWSNWNGGEPNNAGNEDYIQFVSGGKWNDLPNISLPYVLEFDYIVTHTPWTLFTTVYTDVNGRYSISSATNPATEWYIQIDASTPISNLSNNDITNTLKIVNGVTSLNSSHYYLHDVNGDGKITISDAYYIGARKQGRFGNWINSFNARLFTPAEYNIIRSNNSNLKLTYPGVSSITISNPTNGGSSNYYIISPGYSGNTTF